LGIVGPIYWTGGIYSVWRIVKRSRNRQNRGQGDVAKDISGNGHDGKIDKPDWVDGNLERRSNLPAKIAVYLLPWKVGFSLWLLFRFLSPETS